jgi:hypothetical protein
MRALFGRKVCNLKELKQLTNQAIKEGRKGQPYTINREVILKDKDFKEFADDFLKDQPWINKDDGGINDKGQVRCIRVTNIETDKKVLVNTEGYDYPRYTGLEIR